MRLFVGLDIPGEVKANLAKLIEHLRPAANLRWSPVSNLHVTTKFIGEWPEARVDEMKSALAALGNLPEIPIAIRGLGWFPNPHNPHVFWAAVRAPESLSMLAKSCDEAAFSLGVEKEKRPFAPHLTLARIDGPHDLSDLRRRVAALPSDEFGEFIASAFHLYLSKTHPSGSVYSKLASFPLTKQPA